MMKRYVSVAAVFFVLVTLVCVGSAWTGIAPPPQEKCCPCFYVEWTGLRTEFGQQICFREEVGTAFDGSGDYRQRLRCGTFCTEPVCIEVAVTRYVTETRVKTVSWWGRTYEVLYTVKVPVQELVRVEIPRLEGEWCGVDPCKYTTWKIRHENEVSVIGGGTTVGDRFYGKIYVRGLPGCDGTYKLYGERNCEEPCEDGDGGDVSDCDVRDCGPR
jgi:hypothetical protein